MRRVASVAMLGGLPALTCYVWVCLTYYDGALVLPRSLDGLARLASGVPAPTTTAVVLYGSWLLLQVLLHLAAPGRWHAGPPLADGSRLRYRVNGWFTFWFSWAALVLAVFAGWIPPTIGYDQFGPLLTTANLVAFAFAGLLYVAARRARDRHSMGHPVDDYVMGASLNPRIREFDLKFFCESRPGLILWVALNASLAAKQYELYGRVTNAMMLVNAFQFLYVADYFFHEEAVLTTWDIKHERFGWMLAWGGLVWVPFTYTIQAYYLATHPLDLSAPAAAGIVGLNMLGYYIFRSANIQKHRFRKEPTRPVWGRPPAYIETASGSLLLTSGWWGVARHLNYLGDLMMGLAWCLTTAFARPLTYFYVVYFVILLVHRERRDHALCLAKYGAAWHAYCLKVPWRIVPRVY